LDDCHQEILSNFDLGGEDPETDAIDEEYQKLGKIRCEIDQLTQELQQPAAGNASQLDGSTLGVGPQLAAVMGLQYDVTKDVRPFSGDDVLAFATFRIQWDRAEARLKEIGKGPIEILQELKRVLRGQALQLVEYLPEIEGNYPKALAQIRRV
jgi:hypothetical protein